MTSVNIERCTARKGRRKPSGVPMHFHGENGRMKKTRPFFLCLLFRMNRLRPLNPFFRQIDEGQQKQPAESGINGEAPCLIQQHGEQKQHQKHGTGPCKNRSFSGLFSPEAGVTEKDGDPGENTAENRNAEECIIGLRIKHIEENGDTQSKGRDNQSHERNSAAVDLSENSRGIAALGQ